MGHDASLPAMSSTPRTSGRRPAASGARRARVAGAVVGASALGVAGANLIHVQRLRRRSAGLTGDLEHAAVVSADGAVGDGRTDDGAALSLMILGDSAARGFGLTDPGTAFPYLTARGLAAVAGRPVAVSSLATDGHTTADVLALQVPEVALVAPDAIVVSVGVNDAIKNTPARDVETGTTAVLDVLTSRCPDTTVVLVPCPDLRNAPGFPRPLNRVVGWRCERVAAAQRRGAAVVGGAVAELGLPLAGDFGADGFHPGERGHAGMARAAVDALQVARGRVPWISD
jgi:lysophospholipase L1-like esterase